MKKALPALIKALITGALFYFLFRSVDFSNFEATLAHSRLEIFCYSLVVLWLGHYICIFRWRLLMRPLMPVSSISNLFGIYCIGLFFNLAFPTAIGGDVVKMYYAGRPSRLYTESFAATLLDRDSGMFAMMIIACAAILVYPVEVPGIPVATIIWITFTVFVIANAAIFTPHLHRPLAGLLRRLRLTRLAALVQSASGAFEQLWRRRGTLMASLLISLVNQMLVIVFIWMLGIGLRLDVPFRYYLAFVPIIALISMIPVSLNGMGLREYAFLSLYGSIGVAPASCVVLGLLASASLLISAIPGGILYIFYRNRDDLNAMAALESDVP